MKFEFVRDIDQLTTSKVEATELAADKIRTGVDSLLTDHLTSDSIKQVLSSNALNYFTNICVE